MAQIPLDIAPDWHLGPADGTSIGADVGGAWDIVSRWEPSQRVIVAVIDDGTDITHEGLAGNVWLNVGETPFNGIDDDGNGYVDDVRGWNFLVDSMGEVIYEARYEAIWGLSVVDGLKSSGMPAPDWWSPAIQERALAQLADLEWQAEFTGIYSMWGLALADKFKAGMGRDLLSLEEIVYHRKAISISKSEIKIVKSLIEEGWTYSEMQETTSEYIALQHNMDPLYNPRSSTEPETGYGNLYSAAASSDHGTHVSGIIAANGEGPFGIQGIAKDAAIIMPIRAVPDGDETDKDVANAIRYAVDNGAKVINMSFGKMLSPERDRVVEAMRYAAANDVLMVHAAGNESEDNDRFVAHPHPGDDPVIQSHFINVGATTAFTDKRLVADFSNYGQQTVDLFAPGDEILSLANNDGAVWMGGTSMASPVVSGVAALIRAYFPELSAPEVKALLIKTCHRPNGEFLLPGSDGERVPFDALCRSGGIVNARDAVTAALSSRKR